jgi:sec-independent protein translocase protein TatA
MEIFSPGHLIPLLIVAALLFFGWKQLPDMAKSVGKSLRIFKTEMKGMSEDDAARDARKTEVIDQAPVAPAEKAPVPPADRPADDASSESSKPSAD